MPLYEYSCECGYLTEEIQRVGTSAPQCPKCGGVMKRISSPIARIQIKWDGVPIRSKGYKEGYAKEYRKSIAK